MSTQMTTTKCGRTSIVTTSIIYILASVILATHYQQVSAVTSSNPVEEVKYLTEQPFRMNMSSTRDILIQIRFDKNALPAKGADLITVHFKTSTISPQFNILSLDVSDTRVPVSRIQLEKTNYMVLAKIKLHANYIGHAILQPTHVEFWDSSTGRKTFTELHKDRHKLPVDIVQFEGVWGVIFIVSVSLLMLISYINMGAQLDEENMKKVIKKPKTLILGFLISIIVMPIITWFVGVWFLSKHPLYLIGSFIFAAGPAATATTIWTVMLKCDKELSLGLQVVSTFGALVTMPLTLYLMESSLSLDRELYRHIRVPYGRLAQTLFALLVALIIGWRLVGRHKKAQEFSQRIFRPLLFSVLIFIIVFSSILYWHIYQMFDWNITLSSLIITLATYIISGILGHFINCDLNRGVAIAITSAYKNSGIAFAVLLVAFDSPDTYIAYVPCLTQIIITSVTLYTVFAIIWLVDCFKPQGQSHVLQAGDIEEAKTQRRKSSRNDSDPKDPTSADGENDELVAMNVTDIDLSPDRRQSEAITSPATGEQITVKVVGGSGDDDDSKNTAS